MPSKETTTKIIFFHGYSGSNTDYNNLPEETARKFNVKVVVPCLPGHKTKPEDLLPLNYKDFSVFAKNIIAQEAKQADQIIVVGFSMGSFLALESLQHTKVLAAFLFHTPFKLKPPFGLPLVRWLARINKFYGKKVPLEEQIWQKNHSRYVQVPSKILNVMYQGSKATKPISSDKPIFFCESTTDNFIDYKGSLNRAKKYSKAEVFTYPLNSITHNPFYYPNGPVTDFFFDKLPQLIQINKQKS